jgi:aquaporin Z
MNILPLFAEFIGTFLLLASILFTGNWLVIGLTLAGITLAIGNISGGHVNPTVSVALYLRGGLSLTETVTYSIAQILGAIASFYTYSYLA